MKLGLTSKSVFEPAGELLTWDSEFWQMRIGRGDTFLDEWARQNTIGCLFMLFGSDEQAGIQEAEAGGARFMDFRVQYDCETRPMLSTYVRPMNETDIEPGAAIARTAFRGLTRFYADPGFPDERCDDLYEGWFRENAADPSVDVLVSGVNNDPAGFVTVKKEKKEASIVLIAVAEQMRGQGIGAMLASAAIMHAYRKNIPLISVVTQGCNIASQRAFQAVGFRLRSSGVWLHKHYGS